MAEAIRGRLLQYLEHLTPNELERFKMYLVDFLPEGCLEGTDRVKVVDLLVTSLGQLEAWELALRIWEKMDLRELWEQARKEDIGSVSSPCLPVSSDERSKYQERMREKFQFLQRRNNPLLGEHELLSHQFTQLLLLPEYHYKEEKQHELLFQGWERANVMENLIEVSSLFDTDQNIGIQSHTVVLQGAAGIGKTTLAIKVLLDWAEGKLYQKRFNYIFYFTCRELNPLEEREISFADLIAKDWPGPQAPLAEIMSQPERLLFIIDGLDELKFPCNEPGYDLFKDWKQQRPVPILLSSLLRKTLLPEASLLLTTRPTALGKFSLLLENTRLLKILGFSVEQRKEYFCKFFGYKDLGEKAFNLVKDNATLFTMCSVPLMNWIVCTCLKYQMERGQDFIQTLKTTTILYMCYINLIIQDNKNFVPQHLKGLCSLAAEGIWQRKLLFEEEDLRRHNLEAADLSVYLDVNIFQKDNDYDNCYSFIHLSFQEVFAALFYVVSPYTEGVKSPDSSIPDVKKLLEECSGNDTSFVVLVVRFLFGFLNAEIAQFLETNFRCRMSPEIKSQLQQWVEVEINRNNKYYHRIYSPFPEWYSHLYETQDTEFVTQALDNIQEIAVNIHKENEALPAVFCIKHCSGARRLFFSYASDLPAYTWKDLFSVINKNQNLKELELSGFRCLDSCLGNLCVELRNPNCYLEELMLENIKITYTCCQYLCSAPSLKSLYLRRIFFVNDGISLTWETLGKMNCQLHSLRINHSETLLLDIFFAFVEKSLTTLNLNDNNFKERDMNILCRFLAKQHCKLQKLSLTYCYLTSTCSQNLFSALRSNKSLENLYLSGNSFEERGIKYLCEVLENPNCKLETLSLTSCKLSPAYSQNLFSALNSNESLKNLDLTENSLEKVGIKLLCKALENPNSKLQTLSLASCHLTPTCSQNLFSALSSIENLKNLYLNGNSFEKEGLKLLCKALENKNCKLEKLGLYRAKFSKDAKKELADLLKIKHSRKNIQIFLDLKIKEEQEQHYNPPQEQETSGSEEDPQTKPEVTSSLSSFDSLKNKELDLERCHNMFLGPNGPVQLELTDKNSNRYRVHFPMAGFYQWPDTGLGFSVRCEVTLDIEFSTWNQHLEETQKQSWVIAGPLFNIKVDPGIVTSLQLPHFIYLQGGKVDISLFKIAHFKEEGMVLENPMRVEPSHVILENPSFSPMGVLLRILHSTIKFLPIYATTLIYHHLRDKDITLHLYLIPSDCTIKKAIDEEEAKFHFLRLHKPPPVTPLYIGSLFLVSGSKHLTIMPTELKLCYQSAEECQRFSEIHSKNVKKNISLNLNDQNGKLIWETLVRSGDLELSCAPVSSALSAPEAPLVSPGLHFVDRHRDQIISRVTSVDMILDKLYSQYLTNEKYEQIRAEKTNPGKMRQLFSLSISWDKNSKDYFYNVLKETHPHLMDEIQNNEKQQ